MCILFLLFLLACRLHFGDFTVREAGAKKIGAARSPKRAAPDVGYTRMRRQSASNTVLGVWAVNSGA